MKNEEQTTQTEDKKPLIPPHILWPGIVVSILLLSVSANVVLVVAATSDGGAQIEADYYQKGVDWDKHRALLADSAALGWRSDIYVERVEARAQALLVTVTDAEGQPVDGLEGTIAANHVTRSDVQTLTLEPVAGSSGQYKTSTHFERAGKWDFFLDLRRDQQRFVQKSRKQLTL